LRPFSLLHLTLYIERTLNLCHSQWPPKILMKTNHPIGASIPFSQFVIQSRFYRGPRLLILRKRVVVLPVFAFLLLIALSVSTSGLRAQQPKPVPVASDQEGLKIDAKDESSARSVRNQSSIMWIASFPRRLAKGIFHALFARGAKKSSAVSDEGPRTLPVLSLCELAENWERYHRQRVRVRAILGAGREQAWLYDPVCRSGEALTDVSLHQDLKEDKKVIDEILARGNNASVILEGFFYGPEPFDDIDPRLPESVKQALKRSHRRYGHMDSFDTKLEVIKIISATDVIGATLANKNRDTRFDVMLLSPSYKDTAENERDKESTQSGEIVGSAGFINAETEEFVDDAPDVIFELDFRGRNVQLRSDRFAALSETLPAGEYCLRSAHDASDRPLAFAPKQHRCFIIKNNRDTRFDVMLLKP
jgi:hypothetical protein